MDRRYFDTTQNGNHSSFLSPTVVSGRCPLPSEICAQSDRPPYEKHRLRPISTHNVSTVRDSEKSSITTNIKSTMGFPTSYRCSVYVIPKSPKMWLKERFFVFLVSQLHSNKVCYKVFCVKTSSSKVVVRPFPYLSAHRYCREK